MIGGQDDAEDKDADAVFAKVEDYIDGRRKRKRDEKFQEHQDKIDKSKKDIQA
jgi:hypothetical protein